MAEQPTTFDVVGRPTTRNTKTGNIPTLTIGSTKEQALASCVKSGCKLLPKSKGGANGRISDKLKLKACYAWNGSPHFASVSMWKKINSVREKTGQMPLAYTVKDALRRAVRSAKVVRVSALGDISAVAPERWAEIEQDIRDAKLKIYGFTAGWRFAGWLKGKLMASNFTMKDADEAVAAGWRSTCVISKSDVEDWTKRNFVTPDGNKAVVCPHQWQHGVAKKKGEEILPRKAINCNICQLCCAEKKGPIILFVEH